MQALGPPLSRGDGRLWAIALALSLAANVVLLGLAGFAAIQTRRAAKPTVAPPVPIATVVTIFPELAAAVATAVPPPSPAAGKSRFARTSADQASPPPESAAFIGERDTLATSDRPPDSAAPPLPSQKGVEPKNPEDLETTQSDFREGAATADSSPAPPAEPASTAKSAAPETPPETAAESAAAASPAREKLMAGPNPVDVAVPENPDATPQQKRTTAREATPAGLPKPPPAKPADDPSFRGYQHKTAIVGSISRTGLSALNVADTPLGRYQAAISRAVELEWQRNCVRHRDFITPGFLTVRFFVESTGKVRTVHFVGEMTTGEVQKGFTLSSIRDAEIPAMPAALKKEFAKEPLELIFNFYF